MSGVSPVPAPAVAPAEAGSWVHGMDGHPAVADWPPVEEGEVRRLAEAYGLEGKVRVWWRSPRPFSASALVEVGGRRLFVKRHHRRVRTAEELLPEHRFIAHLRRRGMTVPEVLETPEGASALAWEQWTYEVHAPAPGRDRYRTAMSWSPFRSLSDAAAAGQALAELHRAAAGHDEPARSPGVLVACWVSGAPDLIGALEGLVAARPALAAVLAGRDWCDELAGHALPHHRRLAAVVPGLPPLWTHNDWHASNLLWSRGPGGDQVRAVIDFGLANRTTAVYDLATAIERHCVGWLEGGSEGRHPTHPRQLSALLAGYRARRPLSPAEAEALPALLPLVHLEQALSELEYFGSVVRSPANVGLAYEDYLLGHLAWFAGPPGQAFLGQLHRVLREGRGGYPIG